jgi:cytochrome c biogenesis protein CcdA
LYKVNLIVQDGIMQQWLQQLFESGDVGWVMIPAAFLAGLLTALGAGCSYAILGAVAGFAASRKEKSLTSSLLICAGFLLAVVAVLSVAGLVAGSIKELGKYGKYFAGFVTIIFGLMALGCIPFSLPKFDVSKKLHGKTGGLLGGMIFGLAMGGASAGCTFSCCAPLLWIMLGAVTAEGSGGLGAVVMALFAAGYSLPMVAVMFGISAGMLSKPGQKWYKIIKIAGGIFLIAMGFYFLLGA